MIAGGWLLLATPAGAMDVSPHRSDRSGLELPDGRRARDGRLVTWGKAPVPEQARAFARLHAEASALWVAWDPDTLVPQRLIVSGIEAPGTSGSAEAGVVFVRTFLARHVDLLAPGATPSSFIVVANDDSAGMRTIGLQQMFDGRPVLGGQISFRFKHDRLVAIGSEALPHVLVPERRGTLAPEDARAAARTWIADDVPGRITAVDRPVGPSILPLVDAAGARYREVVQVQVHVEAPASRWTVYVDASTGDPVAREQTLSFASATVRYNVPVRGPLGERESRVAPFAFVNDGGQQLLTDVGGQVFFAAAPTELEPTVSGPLVWVSNVAGPAAVGSFPVSDGAQLVWDARSDELVDAQLSAFIHASVVKQRVRAIDPSLGWLELELPVNVNIDDQCNAFSDGNSINFYQSSRSCENTARLADVVYHEFGHSVHVQSLIPGVGFFDRALSEGISDYLSATITGDSGVARGFFFDDTPLRELDPPDFEYRWPEDRGQVHAEGRIIGGALWDLRKLLVAKLGSTTGIAHTDRIWYEATRRAVDIPSMYVEALIVDDDDGDLANGTPNGCEINAAFGPHGLYSVNDTGGHEEVLPIDEWTVEGHRVRLLLSVPVFPGCPVAAAPELEYRPRGQESSTTVSMVPATGGYEAFAEGGAGEVVQYRVRVNYSAGTERSLPDNYVDPWYEHFVGEIVPLYCTSFDDAATGWSLGELWEVGQPSGLSPVDPPAGRSGMGNVLGVVLEGDGLYTPFATTQAKTPVVDTSGFDHVRLQYWRWLTVEDGHFDQATILADDQPVWGNHATPDENFATFHHVDKEWRFHDVDLSAQAADGQVQVEFMLESDPGLHFGGWTLDDLCIVGVREQYCGNGIIEPSEECDDGNREPGDGCSPECRLEDTDPSGGGGSGQDSGSGGSGGGEGEFDTDGPSADDLGLVGRGCGCTSAPAEREGWLGGLALLALAIGRRRQR